MFNIGKKMNPDPLNIVVFLTHKVFKYNLVKVVCYLVLLVHGTWFFANTYLFVINFSGKFFAKYAATYFIPLHGLVAIVIALTEDRAFRYIDDMISNEFWNVNKSSKKARETLQEETIFLRKILIILLFLSQVIVFFYDILGYENTENFIFAMFYDMYMKQWGLSAQILCIISLVLNFVIGYFSGVHTCYVGYIASHTKYQLYIMKDLALNIMEGFEHVPKENLIGDLNFQRAIHERLSLLADQHQMLISFTRKTAHILFPTVLSLTTTGTLSSVSVMVGMLNLLEEMQVDLFIFAFYLMMTFFVGCALLYAILPCQGVSDAGDEFYLALLECPWIYLNKDNKTMYAIILMNSQQNITFSKGLILLDNSFLIKFSKSVYTVVTLIFNFK